MQTHYVARERLFNIRLSEEEAARLDRLASHYGLNAAGVIRMLLKREDDALPTIVPASASGRPYRRTFHDPNREPRKKTYVTKLGKKK